jgi:hypothetical protein
MLYKVLSLLCGSCGLLCSASRFKKQTQEAASSAQHRPSTTAQCSCDLIIPFHIWPSKAHVSKDPCLLLSKNEKQLA